ncbi:response regulator [Nostoc sp. NIES-2111]
MVEDSALIAGELLKRLEQQSLQMAGWAMDEDGGVAMITGAQPDAVILDLSLPVGSGLGVPKRIRAAGSTARVLVLSNFDHPEMRSACFQAGADSFFDKHTQVDACIRELKQLNAEAMSSVTVSPRHPVGE